MLRQQKKGTDHLFYTTVTDESLTISDDRCVRVCRL